MHISFTPPLGGTIHVSASHRTRKPTVLHFKAFLSSVDYEHVAAGHVKVQAWSDIPAHGRGSGEWGEADFALEPPGLDSLDGFSLLPINPQHDGRKSLSLAFSVPVSEGQSRFSFTYRLMYPGGETKWLGQYGQNGTLVINDTDSESGLSLTEGWLSHNDAYTWHSGVRAAENMEVAQLLHPADYNVWALGPENRFSRDAKASSLVVLIPRVSSYPIVLPPTWVVAATPSAFISMSSRGAITISGTGSLLSAACESTSDIEAAISRVATYCSSRVRVASCAPGHIVLASADSSTYPIDLAIIPISSSNTPCQVRLPLQSLSSLLREGLPFCVFSPVPCRGRFFARKGAEDLDETLSFVVDPSGGNVLLAPVESIHSAQEEWQAGIVSPNTPAALAVQVEGLPTPPPSPRLRPRPSQTPDPSSGPTPESDSSSRLSSPSSVKHGGVLAYLWHIFVFFFSWFSRIFLRRRIEKRTIKRITNERTNERTPLLQDGVQRQRPQPFDSTPPSIVADVASGKVTILFQSSRPNPTFNVSIRLNGENVDRNVQQIGDTMFVVEFDSEEGGRLKIGM